MLSGSCWAGFTQDVDNNNVIFDYGGNQTPWVELKHELFINQQ